MTIFNRYVSLPEGKFPPIKLGVRPGSSHCVVRTFELRHQLMAGSVSNHQTGTSNQQTWATHGHLKLVCPGPKHWGQRIAGVHYVTEASVSFGSDWVPRNPPIWMVGFDGTNKSMVFHHGCTPPQIASRKGASEMPTKWGLTDILWSPSPAASRERHSGIIQAFVQPFGVSNSLVRTVPGLIWRPMVSPLVITLAMEVKQLEGIPWCENRVLVPQNFMGHELFVSP